MGRNNNRRIEKRMKSLSIIIVNWNTKTALKNCLVSIEKVVQKSYFISEVIVIDNHSIDESLYLVRQMTFSFHLFIIKNKANKGFAKACNQGAAIGKGDYFLFLNPDTIVKADTFEKSIYYMNKINNQLGALGVQLLDETGEIQRTCSRLPKKRYYLAKCLGINFIFKKLNSFMLEWDHKKSRKVEEVMGAYFLVPQKVFYQLKGFDERFFVYYEEVDFCARLKKAGYYVYYLATAQIFHKGGGASSQVKAKRLFYEMRSRYQYEKKYSGILGAWITKQLIYLEGISRLVYLLFFKKYKEIQKVKKAYKMLHIWFRNQKQEFNSQTKNF